jgi:hypothetical protein
MGTFSIRVVNENGDPMEGITVLVSFGIWNGHSEEFTDNDGWVEFDNLNDDLTHGEIYVNGNKQGDYSTGSGDSYSFTINDD